MFPTSTGNHLHLDLDHEGIILQTAAKLLVQFHLGEASEHGPMLYYSIRTKM